MKQNQIKKILISRTDRIGDVVLTLPIAGLLKQYYPKAKIAFLGKTYTQPIVEQSAFIDEFYNFDTIKKTIKEEKLDVIGADVVLQVFPNKKIARATSKTKSVRLNIGTSHRWYHWFFCNKLVHFSRRKSNLHEAQLNMKLLRPLGIKRIPDLKEIPALYGWKNTTGSVKTKGIFSANTFNLIFQMKSKGSSREWPMQHFFELAKLLNKDHYHIFISGTKEEGNLIHNECPEIFDLEHVHDYTGKWPLKFFVEEVVPLADGLIAASTGPLHIAAAAGINTLGVYPSIKPMHPGRWAPLGVKASAIAMPKICNACRSSLNCECINKISPEAVKNIITNWKKIKR